MHAHRHPDDRPSEGTDVEVVGAAAGRCSIGRQDRNEFEVDETRLFTWAARSSGTVIISSVRRYWSASSVADNWANARLPLYWPPGVQGAR